MTNIDLYREFLEQNETVLLSRVELERLYTCWLEDSVIELIKKLK